MANDSEFGRRYRAARRAVTPGSRDMNLPIASAVPAAQKRKKVGDANTRQAVGRLGDLMRGKDPFTRK